MMVRPDEISANSAPSTRPLKHCETKVGQLITPSSAIFRDAFCRSRRLHVRFYAGHIRRLAIGKIAGPQGSQAKLRRLCPAMTETRLVRGVVRTRRHTERQV